MALRKQRKNRLALVATWIVAILMVMGVFGIVLDYGVMNNDQSYGKFSFSIDQSNPGASYITTVNGKRQAFAYYPSQLESITLDKSVPGLMQGAQFLIVTFDPVNRTAQDLTTTDLIRFDLANQMPGKIISGVLQQDARYPFPVMTCTNATASAPILVLAGSNETSISLQGNCIYLYGSGQGMLQAYDRLLYGMYGVMS